MATKQLISVLEGHSRGIRCMQYDEESSLMATGSLDQSIRVWNVKTGDCKVLLGHTMSVKCLQFVVPLNLLISGSGDGTLRGWDLTTGACVKSESMERVLALGFNGKYIVTAGTTKLIVRDFNTWAPLYHMWTSPVSCLLVQDTRIIAGSKSIAVYSFDADQSAILRYMKREQEEESIKEMQRVAAITSKKPTSRNCFSYVLLASLAVILAFLVQVYFQFAI